MATRTAEGVKIQSGPFRAPVGLNCTAPRDLLTLEATWPSGATASTQFYPINTRLVTLVRPVSAPNRDLDYLVGSQVDATNAQLQSAQIQAQARVRAAYIESQAQAQAQSQSQTVNVYGN
jgi:hypothetical protein